VKNHSKFNILYTVKNLKLNKYKYAAVFVILLISFVLTSFSFTVSGSYAAGNLAQVRGGVMGNYHIIFRGLNDKQAAFIRNQLFFAEIDEIGDRGGTLSMSLRFDRITSAYENRLQNFISEVNSRGGGLVYSVKLNSALIEAENEHHLTFMLLALMIFILPVSFFTLMCIYKIHIRSESGNFYTLTSIGAENKQIYKILFTESAYLLAAAFVSGTPLGILLAAILTKTHTDLGANYIRPIFTVQVADILLPAMIVTAFVFFHILTQMRGAGKRLPSEYLSSARRKIRYVKKSNKMLHGKCGFVFYSLLSPLRTIRSLTALIVCLIGVTSVTVISAYYLTAFADVKFDIDAYPYDIKLTLREFDADRFHELEENLTRDEGVDEVAFMYKIMHNMELSLPKKYKNHYTNGKAFMGFTDAGNGETAAYNQVMIAAVNDDYARNEYFTNKIITGSVDDILTTESGGISVIVTDNVDRRNTQFTLNDTFPVVKYIFGKTDADLQREADVIEVAGVYAGFESNGYPCIFVSEESFFALTGKYPVPDTVDISVCDGGNVGDTVAWIEEILTEMEFAADVETAADYYGRINENFDKSSAANVQTMAACVIVVLISLVAITATVNVYNVNNSKSDILCILSIGGTPKHIYRQYIIESAFLTAVVAVPSAPVTAYFTRMIYKIINYQPYFMWYNYPHLPFVIAVAAVAAVMVISYVFPIRRIVNEFTANVQNKEIGGNRDA
jgi:ABC-type antimicrobial peptide transport system, permease component